MGKKITLLFLLLVPLYSFAQLVYSTQDGVWSDPTNWSLSSAGSPTLAELGYSNPLNSNNNFIYIIDHSIDYNDFAPSSSKTLITRSGSEIYSSDKLVSNNIEITAYSNSAINITNELEVYKINLLGDNVNIDAGGDILIERLFAGNTINDLNISAPNIEIERYNVDDGNASSSYNDINTTFNSPNPVIISDRFYANGTITLTGGATLEVGDYYADQTSYSMTVNGDMTMTKSVSNPSNFKGDLTVNGILNTQSITMQQSGTDITAYSMFTEGSLTLSTGTSVTTRDTLDLSGSPAKITAEGDITVTDGGINTKLLNNIKGNIIANDNINVVEDFTMQGGDITTNGGDLVAQGSIQMNSGSSMSIDGDIFFDGDFIMSSNTDLYAKGTLYPEDNGSSDRIRFDGANSVDIGGLLATETLDFSLANLGTMNVRGDLIADVSQFKADTKGDLLEIEGDLILTSSSGAGTQTMNSNLIVHGETKLTTVVINVEGAQAFADGSKAILYGKYHNGECLDETKPTGYNEGCLNSKYDGGKIIEATSLPVELLSFEIIPSESNLILWSTASETDNDYFTLYRSTDGITYEEIAIENGYGTTSHKQDYDYTDFSAPQGVVYYKLTQTDFDGTVNLLGIKTVISTQTEGITISTTPGKITITSPKDHQKISIHTITGRHIISTIVNKEASFYVSSGTYVLTTKSESIKILIE